MQNILRRALYVLLLVPTPVVYGQTLASRAAEIEAARERKAAMLAPDEPSAIERGLRDIKDKKLMERFTAGIAGFRVKLGGLVSGSGFALGPEYLRRDLWKGHGLFRGAAQSSFRKFQKYDLQFSLPPSRGSRFFLDTHAIYRRYPAINYHGPGPDSRKEALSNYRLEDLQTNVLAGLKLAGPVRAGGGVGYLRVNTGPGENSEYISTDQIFAPATTPGINEQADFLRSSVFLQLDTRDIPGGPRSGSNYIVEFSKYSDQTLQRFDFHRLDLNLQQYVGFFNGRRVFALRASSTLTFPGSGQRVPFYLQPSLGGSEDLRGYRAFRFQDDNLVNLNAEYRWETFSGLDMAIFADAGKVFGKHSQWNLHDLESSVGLGFRFNVRNNVFLRFDTAFSHEGYKIWIKFNNVFSEGPLSEPSTQSVY